jgi:hypothetical protein
MLVSLFISRAALSVSMIIFLAAAMVHSHFVNQIKTFLRCPVLIGMTALFIIPMVSGLWSSDVEEWADFMRIKLPLLAFPVAFAGSWQLGNRQWKIIALVFLFLCFTGCCWSMAQYLSNVAGINASYLRAKAIPTPLENDHVRFSWMICMAVITSLLLLEQTANRWHKGLLVLLGLFFAVYLHILSARTGLLCLYIFMVMLLLHIVLMNGRRKFALVMLASLVLLPLLAWNFLPTFRNRISYIVYDLSYARNNVYLPGSNDGNRILSLKAGWSMLKEYPMGTGTGDVFSYTNQWFDRNVPGMLATDRYYPSSEWLIYAGAAGWAGVILFTVIMVLPFFYPTRRASFYWVALHAVAAASFIFDVGLEVQFGVFIYTFLVLWWWKWLNQNPQEA